MGVSAVRVNPASGDDHTTLSQNGEVIGTVDKGTILKVVGKSGGSYQVQIPAPKEKIGPKGGSGDTGNCIASPYTFLYNNPEKHKSLGRINNGTWLKILEADDDTCMYKVSCMTTNGYRTGYMEARYIFRSCLKKTVIEESGE